MKMRAYCNRITGIVLLITMCITLSGCSLFTDANEDSTTDGNFHSKTITAYLYDDDKTKVNALFRDGLNLPYINMEDYFSNIFKGEYSTRKSGRTYIIDGPKGSAVFDPDNDTVTFERYEDFISDELIIIDKADTVATEEYVVAGTSEQKPYTFNFGKYGIDIYSDGRYVYMPVSSANLLTETTYRGALYRDEDIYFTETYDPVSWIDMSDLLDNDDIDPAISDLNYKELCFLMDNLYGHPSKGYLANEINANGFDNTLKNHDDDTRLLKDLLTSDDMLEYYYGLKILGLYTEDGGHSCPSIGLDTAIMEYDDSFVAMEYKNINKQLKDKKTILPVTLNQGVTLYNTLSQSYWYRDKTKYKNLGTIIGKARESAFSKYNKVRSWNGGDIILTSSNDTVAFSFNGFSPNVFEPMMWSLDYAKQNNVKNFVIDLTCNGGGQLSTLVWILNILTDQKTTPAISALTDNKLSIQALVDKNLDGEYNDLDNDSYRGNLRLAVLTSSVSYSCGNILPTLLKDNKIPVIGETSGGGTADLIFHLGPMGLPIMVSGPNTFTNNNYESIDEGATPDYVLVRENASSIADYLPLYDIDTIRKDMDEYYSRR